MTFIPSVLERRPPARGRRVPPLMRLGAAQFWFIFGLAAAMVVLALGMLVAIQL